MTTDDGTETTIHDNLDGCREAWREDDGLVLYGVTHRVELSPVEDDRWDYMLTVTSPAGEGQALLTPDECHRLQQYLLNGRDPGYGTVVDHRCRCTGVPHEKYGDDCMRAPDPDDPALAAYWARRDS